MKKAFTLIELVVAVAILALIASFAGVVFSVSVGSYRTTAAHMEIMQNLRAITDQLDSDFRSLQTNGYLVLRSEVLSGREFNDPQLAETDFRADRIYYFCTGDFQSWFAGNVRSNIARVYFGHDGFSLTAEPADIIHSWCSLVRDIELLTAQPVPPSLVDCNNVSFAQRKADRRFTLDDANGLLSRSLPLDVQNDPNSVRSLLCQNVGALQIEWTDGTISDGTISPAGELVWWGLGNPIGGQVGVAINEVQDPPANPVRYDVEWNPFNQAYWPRALRFTFALYDARGIMDAGQSRTYIAYLGD